MNNLIQNIKNKNQDILTGEIGALLHDIGKCHPAFIGAQSLEHETGFRHENIDEFLDEELVNLFKNENCKLKINDKEIDIYSIVKKHHDRNSQNDLIDLLKSCDRLDSADDKGVVRKKQPKDSTLISSPFGFPKEKIDLLCLQKRLEDLQTNLTELFQNYISGTLDITCFRKCLINNLKTTFSHVLGETRIPANDVTLWDHSHSTASLFKSILCAMVLGENHDKAQLQWRIFGFCWNGIDFINKGKEVADIIQRNSIIKEIKEELKDKFENQIPIGNVAYEDNNGIYFTFPALEGNKARTLARECAEIGLEAIRGKSDNEIWPFFTLSKPSRTLNLAKELKFASKKRTIPKMTPTLFPENQEKDKNEEKISDNPEMSIPQSGEDICPICRLRAKSEKDVRCDVCKERRRGRLDSWFSSRENTIWVDEVADDNNRIALLALSFDLSKWLDGTMVGTIFSQTFEDWKNSKDAIKFFSNKQNTQKLEKRDIKINDTPINLSKNCLKIITDEDPLKDLAFKSELINTFYEDVKSSQDKKDDNYIKNLIDNLKTRVSLEPFTSSNLQKLIFTQNPSPARLYRIWKETEEFFDLVTQEIKGKVYPHKWKRIKFAINYEELKSKTSEKTAEKTPYIIKIRGLESENLLILHTSNGEFYTIESLEKFKFKDKSGIDAVKDALSKGIDWIAKEDEPNINLLRNGQNIESKDIKQEDYYPLIEITKSPLSLRLIVPASDSMVILESTVKLYNQRFEKVLGKLPLNIGLLVSKRKFPLYVLLDAEERLFHTKEFKETVTMDVWWDITSLRNDEHYSFYPINKSDNQKYNLDDLALLSNGKPYALYPGYFDFDLLLGTQDRYNITYEGKRRANEDYRLFSNRPYYFYQIPQMIDLWEILKNNISSAQINFIEEILINKLQEWRNVNEKSKEEVFRKFTEATVKDAFSNNWDKLRIETQDFILSSAFNGLLLDTIILFRHTIKEGEIENE
ncbi:MAG: CRISPR-associated protein Csx11 [Mesotoga infera]|uniref:CRISPR-associated protein Csx11 n=1 Tax=Mesotoga infera TaxID=1236046 RepID=A0A117M8G3_9BACT|nr:MAG: CRISPR-associated protein Csx11 [Mesotoga infera]